MDELIEEAKSESENRGFIKGVSFAFVCFVIAQFIQVFWPELAHALSEGPF